MQVAGREVPITNPDKVVFPAHRDDQARPGAVLPRGGRRRAARGGGPADDPQALRQGHRRGGVLPEAGAREAPGLGRRRRAASTPRGTLGQGGRGDGCRGPGLGGQPRLRRPQPAPGPRRRPRPPRRVAGRPRPDARGGLGADRRRRARRPRGARRPRSDRRGRRPPAPAGFHIYARIDPQWAYPKVRLAARDRGPRGRATGAASWPPADGGRRSGTASSSTSTRTPRTARSPRRTRCGPPSDARVSTPLAWDEVAGCRPEMFTVAYRAGALRPDRRPVGRDGRQPADRWSRCWLAPSSSARPRSLHRARTARDGARLNCR